MNIVFKEPEQEEQQSKKIRIGYSVESKEPVFQGQNKSFDNTPPPGYMIFMGKPEYHQSLPIGLHKTVTMEVPPNPENINESQDDITLSNENMMRHFSNAPHVGSNENESVDTTKVNSNIPYVSDDEGSQDVTLSHQGERTGSTDSQVSDITEFTQDPTQQPTQDQYDILGDTHDTGETQTAIAHQQTAIAHSEHGIIYDYMEQRVNLLIHHDYRIDERVFGRIQGVIDECFTYINDENITDIYISYLYNPLELLYIGWINSGSSDYKSVIGNIDYFNSVIREYVTNTVVVNEMFNLLYDKLNSLMPVCNVIIQPNIQQQQRWNYVLLYLTTIPAKLFIRFAGLVLNFSNPQQQLFILQNLNSLAKHIDRVSREEYETILHGYNTYTQTHIGRELMPVEILTIADLNLLKQYPEDILRINEISDVTFDELIDSYKQSRDTYEGEIDNAIERASKYPKIISDYGEILTHANPNTNEIQLSEIGFIGYNEDIEDVGYKPRIRVNDGEASMGKVMRGGASNNGSFGNYLRVLKSLHDLINNIYTIPGDLTSIESIKDDYIDYADGDFSGKKIVLDFLGMFMGAVIFFIQDPTPENDQVSSYFTYERNESKKSVNYVQKYIGGDVIMAGYSTEDLYKKSRGNKPPTSIPFPALVDDIKRGIELYAFDDMKITPPKNKKQRYDKVYDELFGDLTTIYPDETPVGWISKEQPSSLSPFINLALTLDGTNLDSSTNPKFVTLTTQIPTKPYQSCFMAGVNNLSYEAICGVIDDMLAGSLDSDGMDDISSMTDTFLKLRKELIGLLVEQGEGVLRIETTDYPAMDENFKLALKNPDIDTFDYNYIYAYVYKNIIRGNTAPLYLPKCMALLNSIMMYKIRETSGNKNPSKDHGWSKLLNQKMYDAYNYYMRGVNPQDNPIEGVTEQQLAMGKRVREFNQDHINLIRSFYGIQQIGGIPIRDGVFYIDYRDGTKSYGVQIDEALPGGINNLLDPFIKKYAVDTCFNSCFTSRPTSSPAGLEDPIGIYENNCVTPTPINTGVMIYKIFAMDACHDTKPGGRTSLPVSNYIIGIANKAFEMIETGLTCESIVQEGRKIDPKNPAMRKPRSWEAACANKITGGEFENALVSNYGPFTKIDKSKLGITPEKASDIIAATTANTYNNAVWFKDPNSGNAGTFVDGGTTKTVQNIHLPNICIKIIDEDGKYLIVIVSYNLVIYGEQQPQIRMLVSLIYKISNVKWLFVTHEFVLGKGISCAQIYDDIYNGMRQQRSSGDYSAELTRNNLTLGPYDPALAVLVVLKKTLCDWLQNFLKLGVHTTFDNKLGFSIEIKDEILISANNSTYPTDKSTFDIGTTPSISVGSFSITGIKNVLMALERTEVNDNKHYLCIPGGFIPSGTGAQSFFIVPYPENTKIFKIKENPVSIPLITSDQYIRLPYVKGGDPADGCYAPRFHLFNYINIFWDKYRSVYSPEHYRYISTLPSLITPTDTLWKPDFCITGDILDLWISFILTKITFIPHGIPPYITENTYNQVINLDPFIDRHSPVYLTTSILTMTGGATKINVNNRRKRKISYSTTKRKLKNGISKKKTKKSNQKKSKMKKSSKNHKKNKMKSKLTKKNIISNIKQR